MKIGIHLLLLSKTLHLATNEIRPLNAYFSLSLQSIWGRVLAPSHRPVLPLWEWPKVRLLWCFQLSWPTGLGVIPRQLGQKCAGETLRKQIFKNLINNNFLLFFHFTKIIHYEWVSCKFIFVRYTPSQPLTRKGAYYVTPYLSKSGQMSLGPLSRDWRSCRKKTTTLPFFNSPVAQKINSCPDSCHPFLDEI